MRVVFPFLAQAHQVLHALPIATALASRHRDVEVHVAAVCESQLDFARNLVARHAPGANVQFDLLPMGFGDRIRIDVGLGTTPIKKYTLLRNRRYFAGFDAIVTPERTSLFLRNLGLRTKLVWTRHGAGDREIGFADDVREFDFVLMAGTKIEQRLLARGLIRPDCYANGVYAKFDWVETRNHAPLFDNGRRTIVYNPHFRDALSSWERMGRTVLDTLAASTRYNLVFAPHIRLFDPPTDEQRRSFEPYRGLPHMRIDLGSERSVDMTYTRGADFYLGDVSSQVAEFVRRPRPCAFLDTHGVSWRDDPNYLSWNLGPVLTSTRGLEEAIDRGFERHAEFAEIQRRYICETFSIGDGPTAPRGADAIVEYLERQLPSRATRTMAA